MEYLLYSEFYIGKLITFCTKNKWLLLQETNPKMENKMYFLKESYKTQI